MISYKARTWAKLYPACFFSDCRPGWIKWNNYCYKFYSKELTWEDAISFCEGHGAILTTIHSKPENEFVYNLSRKTTWIAAHDKGGTDSWEWTDGTPWSFSILKYRNPNNRGVENCLQLGRWQIKADESRWRDARCDARAGFVCKMKV